MTKTLAERDSGGRNFLELERQLLRFDRLLPRTDLFHQGPTQIRQFAEVCRRLIDGDNQRGSIWSK